MTLHCILALALTFTAPMPAAAQPLSDEPPAASTANASRDVFTFLAGAAFGLVVHEGGHFVFDEIFDARPDVVSVHFGPVPFFAISPQRPLSPKQLFTVTSAGFWTQALTSELLLTHQCGFEPLGQVMGSCVYHVGWQYVPRSTWGNASGEMAVMTESQVNARRLAFSRLGQEVKLLGGDGVVGVRFTREQSNFGTGDIEFMAIGTAVRRIKAPPLAANAEPFVSNLSGQDHWLLRQAGFAPLGFVFGTCAWFQYPDWRSQNAMLSWQNAELTSLSQGVYTAREVAMNRMHFEGRRLAAHGVVGVTFENYVEVIEADPNQSQSGGFIMHCTVWGTAIGPDPFGPAQPNPISPVLFVGP